MSYKYEPKFDFDVIPFIQVANTLVMADEVERALLVLDNLPGYYRDHVPPVVSDLKRKIRSQIYTAQDYSQNPADYVRPIEIAALIKNTLRGRVFFDELEKNEKPVCLVDYGPGDYSLPLAMKHDGHKFSYYPISLEHEARSRAEEVLASEWVSDLDEDALKDHDLWYVAYEIIEHLHNPWEIRYQMDRLPKPPEKIFLSTPLYTYDRGNPNWQTNKLPHLRTYTPQEFVEIYLKMFPEYTLKLYQFDILTIQGDLKRI